MKDRLGEMLLRENIIDPDQLEQARDFQRNNGGTVYGALVKLDYLTEDDVVEFLARKLDRPTITLDEIDVDLDSLRLIPVGIAQKYLVIPYGQLNSTLHVAMADPTDLNAIDDIKFMTGLAVEISIATESEIRKALDTYYDTGERMEDMLDELGEDDLEAIGADTSELDVSDAAKLAEEAPVVKLVNWFMREAIAKGASDIHVEPYEKVFRVRFRIDGSLYEFYKPPLKLRNPVVSRLKIMSRLDIAERRLPQDGRIKLKIGKGRDID
ncbi:MAG TPA: ATPase, T2SS/T4P/T4SS family, partial [Desulfomonilaceae bacterium]|nr:ATPase, T2SS/T4P/T4SS family [Desulfomonilaceae bacterium]